jgi:predicted Zn-dependent peptidase
MRTLHRLLPVVVATAALSSLALAQDGHDWSKASSRGNVHSPGWTDVMKLKGEPVEPRFPEVGKGIERHVLPNGLVVYLAEDHRLPLIRLEMLFRGGDYYESEGGWGVTGTMGQQMRQGGTASLTPDELDDKLAFLAAEVSTSFGDETGSASLDVLVKNFEPALALFADVVLKPRFDEQRLAIAKRRALFALAHRNDDPGQILGRELATLLYGANHPRGRQTTPEMVDAITRDALVSAHSRFVRPNNAWLAAVGDFDAKAMLATIETAFAGWAKGADVTTEWPKVDTTPKPGVYLIDREINQSNIAISHLGVNRDHPDRYAISLMNNVLGGGSFSSRVTERVRSDEGLAYSAGTRFDAGSREIGTFAATVQTKTETTAKAIASMLDEIRKIRVPRTLSRNEFETARESRLYSHVFGFEDRTQNVVRLMRHELDGRPADQDRRDFEGYKAVTPADVERVAQAHLRPEALTIFVVGNASDIGEPLKAFGPVTVVPLRDFGEAGAAGPGRAMGLGGQ